MSNIWNYGQYDLDKDALLKYLQSNLDSYMEYNGYDEDQKQQFRGAVGDISTGITNDTITGDGFNKFHDSTGTIQKNDTTANAFGYIHTVANAMGKKFGSVKKKEDKENEEETPQQEMFDYNKHGLSYGFNRKYNPFGTDSTYSLWKSGFKSQEDLNNALLDYIGQHKMNIQNSNYDFSKSQIDKDSYINMLTDLESDIKVDGINNSDQSKLKFLGLNPSNFILPIKEEKQGFQGEGNKTGDPFGHIEWQNNLSEEEQKVQNQKEAEKIAQMPMSEYIGQDWTESDKLRLKALGLDVISIIDPEPISASGLGFYSDYLNQKADELEGGSFGWDDALNYGISAVGAIPILGDATKGANLIRKMGKLTTKLMPVIGAVVTGQAIENGDEIITSAQNILVNHDFSKVEDWRNLSTALQLVMGGYGSYRSIKGRKQANSLTDQAEEALVVQLKNNGKTENYQFSGKDKEDLLALKDNPEEFNKYLRENFEGLDKVEAAKIKTTKERDPEASKFNIFAKRKIKSQEVQTATKPVYEQGKIPGKWDRARYFLDNTDEAVKPTRKQVAEIPKADKQETKQESKQETSKAESSETPKQEEFVVKQQTETQKQETPKVEEQPKTTVEEPIKTEEKPNFSKAREAVSEKKSESVKATEIEPDNKSKATEAADTKSEVAKYNASNIRKEFDKLKGKNKKKAKWVLKNAKQNKEYADLVKSDPSYATAEFNEMLAALQKADKKTTYEQAFKMLTDAGYYKEGGIIKAQGGIKAPDWYKARYGNRTSLLGWTRDKNSQNWITDEHTFHGNADSLDTVYQANKAYTDDQSAVTSDIQNYYKPGENISDFINRYNSDAAKLRATWETDQSYNGNSAEHNPLFRNMFTSRSKMQEGNPLYNLNYQEDLQDKIGSTTWHRRMDTYEKEWENLTDAEKLKRMHSIELGNDSNVWVYKKANGDIAQVEDQELDRLLNYYPESEEKMQTLNSTGQDHIGSEQKQEKVEVPKPEKPNDSFFTPDKVLAALNYFRAVGHNRKQLDLANRMVPLLYDPIEHHRYVYGDLGAIAKGQEAAGQIRSQASKPLTSDGSLATAQRLEGENLARQYILQGWQSDNETMRKMSELAWQQEKENRENRYNIAMKNRENMHQVSKEKLMALMTKERSDYESLTNHINEWRTWLAAKQKADSDKANLLYNRQLSSYVSNNPDKYIPNWNLYEGLWNRYNNGEQLTANEQKTIQQIQSRLADAYYNEIYGKGDYFGYGITRAPWEAKFAKGGRLTKSQVDTVIKFLKESNNNYNKAVDRSVRGLYNHIKLQRKK